MHRELGATTSHYNANYGNFHADLYAEIRRDAYGEDIGQTGWSTAEEQDRFLCQLQLSEGKRLLDIACGSGGPALRIAERTGCSVTGIDLHEQAIATARRLVSQRKLEARAEFLAGDAGGALPFPENHFDAVTCIDGINHLPERPRVLAEWKRVLRPGGRLLFTDATTVTGPLTAEEIRVRSSIGFFLFVPTGYDSRIVAECGLKLLVCEEVTENTATLAERRREARAARSGQLRDIEGKQNYESQQEFLAVAARLAKERRLSRYLYVAEKPHSGAR